MLALTGCSTTAYHSNGTKWFTTYADATTLTAVSGSDTFSMSGLRHSTPTYVALAGATDVGAVIAGGAFALTGTGSATQKAAVLMTQHVTPRYQKAAPRAVVAP